MAPRGLLHFQHTRKQQSMVNRSGVRPLPGLAATAAAGATALLTVGTGVAPMAEAPTAEMTALPTPMLVDVDSELPAVTGTPVTGNAEPSTAVTGTPVTGTAVIGTPGTGMFICLRARRESPAPGQNKF